MTPLCRHRRAAPLSHGRLRPLIGVILLASCAAPPAPPPPAGDGGGGGGGLQPMPRHVTAPSLLHVKCPHVPDPLPGLAPPAPAGPAQSLTPGHWDWVDGSYAWAPPHWQPRADGPARAWQDGYWEANGGACVWHNGRFLPAALP